MISPQDNRAFSALFRVFGGAGDPVLGEAREVAKWRGMHCREHLVFSVMVPMTVLVSIAGPLMSLLGNYAGLLLAGPVAFLALNILPFVLGGTRSVIQWRLWLSAMLVWAIYRRDAPGITGLFSHAWIGIGVMNLAAMTVIGWSGTMRWKGKGGILWRAFVLVGLHAGAVAIGFKFGWMWGLVAGGGIAAICCAAILNPNSRILGEIRSHTEDGGILVTIDDGPDAIDTPVILDLLDRHHAKAIFFVIGEKVLAHPDLAREIIRRGHEIGNHTLTHPQASFWCAGPWRTWREISGCQKIVEDVTGFRPRWFRAPVGHRNLFTHPVAESLGLAVMGWSLRGYDAVERDESKVLARILPDMKAGDIVLVHEATPIAAAVVEGVLAASHLRR